MATSEVINIEIIINTLALKKEYKNPSQDPDNPTQISDEYQYMVVSDKKEIFGQGTANLDLRTKPGDVVRLNMSSEYNNLDFPCLIYKVTEPQNNGVFTDFEYVAINSKTIGPDPDEPNELPPLIVTREFWYSEATVDHYGSEELEIFFTVYKRNANGKPKLHGYFSWNPNLTAKK